MTGAVEGVVDDAVLRRIAEVRGMPIDPIYVTNGKANLIRRLPGFNAAARYEQWLVLVDLNSAICAPELVQDILPAPEPHMTLRVAVRAVEAWLLADIDRISEFLGVSAARLPLDPDEEPDPKQTMVDIARHSRRRSIRDDLVPRPGGGRPVGPAYSARMIEFASDANGWRPEVARLRSNSLSRCLDAV